jgi:hypothetical protein
LHDDNPTDAEEGHHRSALGKSRTNNVVASSNQFWLAG